MGNRSDIPADIRRQALVEAGHRCAIQTCRSSADVDIHHIVPWSQTKSHELSNLIALCPNCHRRADRGEIDRKSLHKYKLICQCLARPPQTHPEPATFLKFSPSEPTRILDASNITSLTDSAHLQVGVGFASPFGDANYLVSVSANGSAHFRVIRQTPEFIELAFDEPCPSVVKLEFRE